MSSYLTNLNQKLKKIEIKMRGGEYKMNKKLLFSIILVVLLLIPTTVIAHTKEEPFVTDLMAGQHIDVGDVSVWNDGVNLYVKYVINAEGWCLTKTHLHVAESLEEIPQKNGNPPPGKFDYQMEHDCVTEYMYTIPLTWHCYDEPFIVAHAVVMKVIEEAPYYASAVIDYYQGLRKDGTSVRLQRSTPEQGLAFEAGQDESNFFSLGFGGWIIVEFDCPIRNGDGNDVKVIEDTWGSYPLETADVYASQDGTTWTYLGEADNTNQAGIHTISEFDLGDLEWAKYIKIVDITDPALHGSDADGYDLNAVESLQDCVQEETAWGDGEDFPGKNWATYFTYEIQPFLVDTVEVYAVNENPTYSNISLESEVQYELEAMGTAHAGDTIDFDAKYSITNRITGDTWTDTVTGYSSHGPTLLDLFVNGGSVDWGVYNTEHIYYWTLAGTGVPVELWIYDIYYPNNTGFITVNIYRLP